MAVVRRPIGKAAIENDYRYARKEIESLMTPKRNTPDGNRLGLAGRLGSEEFALLIEGRFVDAVDVAQCLREDVNERTIRAGNDTIGITCSVGVAEWEAYDTIDTLLRRADVALYEAKRSDRNRVVAADSFPLNAEHNTAEGSLEWLLVVADDPSRLGRSIG